MQKFQVQFIVGPYTVNHITEGETKEEVLFSFRDEWSKRKEEYHAWTIEDVVMDPQAISLLRVMPYFEKLEGETIEVENA